MTRHGTTTSQHDCTSVGDVVEAGRQRTRRQLIAVLAALAIAATALLTMWPMPDTADHRASPCLVFGTGPVNNGKAVIAAGVANQVPESGILAGLTAAMQETDLRNYANPNVPESLAVAHDGLGLDRDAIGILQQSAAAGTATQRMSPAAAADHFYDVMRTIDGWQTMAPQQLASLVQRSARPQGYASRVPAARVFYRDHLEEVLTTHCDESAPATTGAAS